MSLKKNNGGSPEFKVSKRVDAVSKIIMTPRSWNPGNNSVIYILMPAHTTNVNSLDFSKFKFFDGDINWNGLEKAASNLSKNLSYLGKKKYIGGAKKITSRVNGHARAMKHPEESNAKVYRKFRNLTQSGFKVLMKAIVTNVDYCWIAEVEKLCIKVFDSYQNGLNSSLGGEGFKNQKVRSCNNNNNGVSKSLFL